ncbi:hypothetical protein OIV83_004845 [Microbotryomycetes sp. JL201]|nr:hypothetical protein OIV83_004845 [Microbotryomycetes sp. JL201]
MAQDADNEKQAPEQPHDIDAGQQQQQERDQGNDRAAVAADHNDSEDSKPRAEDQQDRDSQILAHIAAASSSSLHLGGNNGDAQATMMTSTTADDDEPTDAFELVARLRSQITDLTSQVTSLNSKLVKSYTQTGDLEDELHETKDHETRLQQRIKELEDYKVRWEKEIERGGWVEKAHVQGEMRQLMSKVLEETKSRETAVEGQKALETEIENLTSSLFDEANKMVAVERMTRARAEEKMQSLEEAGSTMKDLFDSVQVNLRETVTKLEGKDKEIEKLKRKMLAAGISPDTPDAEKDPDAKEEVTVSDGTQMLSLDRSVASSTAPHTPSMHALAPPRLLTSALPFQEFLAFVAYLRQLRTSVLSRPLDSVAFSGAYAGSGPHMSMRGFPTLSAPKPANQTVSTAPPTVAQLLTPHLPLSTHLSQPFLKRCVEEDSDPVLRLDIAPGFGFLSRRNVATAVVDGTLVIEPFFAGPGAELPSGSCAMCGTSLERWSKGAAVAKPITPSVANVNSTMKKMLGGGSSWFSGSSSKSGTSTPPNASAPTSEKPTSPTKTTFTAMPFEFPSKDPIDPRHQIHIVRINDTAANKYAICPAYCLARLRAACEFWTYVRAIERGLLLEEGFKFVKGWADPNSEGGQEVQDVNENPTPAIAGLGLTGASTEGPLTVTVSSDIENAGEDSKGSEAATDQDNHETESNAAGSPEMSKSPALTSHGNASSGSVNKPPVPKRSAARGSRPQTPVMREEKQASYPSSPNLSIDTHLGPNGQAVKTGPPTAATVQPEAVIVGATALGWEDYCWNELVRLKECMFWTRMAAVDKETGEAVSSRLVATGGRS